MERPSLSCKYAAFVVRGATIVGAQRTYIQNKTVHK